jgi:hypothetical protein
MYTNRSLAAKLGRASKRLMWVFLFSTLLYIAGHVVVAIVM